MDKLGMAYSIVIIRVKEDKFRESERERVASEESKEIEREMFQ